jgi:tetratricopeptide (TPR) repeat protein
LLACGRALEVAEQLTSEQIASLDLFTQGQIFFKQGQWESAVAAFQQIRRDLPVSYLYLGRCFAHLGLPDLAIKQWGKGLKQADEQLAREYYYELGLAQLDQPQVALNWFVKCYEIDAVYREVGDWVARLRNRAA